MGDRHQIIRLKKIQDTKEYRKINTNTYSKDETTNKNVKDTDMLI